MRIKDIIFEIIRMIFRFGYDYRKQEEIFNKFNEQKTILNEDEINKTNEQKTILNDEQNVNKNNETIIINDDEIDLR